MEMDENTILKLLSSLAKQLVDQFNEGRSDKQQWELANRMAEVTWEGLIFMMRQLLASGEDVILNDLGCFKKREEQWIFEPAASLAEAEAINISMAEAYQKLAHQTLFYLKEGTELLGKIPRDLELESAPLTKSERQTREIFGLMENVETRLSADIKLVVDRLMRTIRRLEDYPLVLTKEELLGKSIIELGLSEENYIRLWSMGITSINDLINESEYDLQNRDLNPNAIDEIEHRLQRFGLALQEDKGLPVQRTQADRSIDEQYGKTQQN
jgi:hypothetical protein